MKAAAIAPKKASSMQVLLRGCSFVLALAGFVAATSGQVTPLSFTGGLTFQFGDGSAVTNGVGWSTRSVAGSGAGNPADSQTMDMIVQTNEVSGIIGHLPVDTNPATPEGSGSTSSVFRWNQPRQFIESRPTGVSYSELLLTLRNNASFDLSSIAIDYDFGIDVLPGESDLEDSGFSSTQGVWLVPRWSYWESYCLAKCTCEH